MVKVQNGQLVPLSQALNGQLDDNKDKKLKFEQEKDVTIPSFTAKGKDKQVYGFSLADIMVTVTVSPEPDMKALRRKGFPVDKNEAKKLDAEIKEEDKAAGVTTGAEAEEEAEEDANPTLKAEEKSTGRRAR